MKKMKIISLILALVMICGVFAACGGSTTEPPADDNAAGNGELVYPDSDKVDSAGSDADVFPAGSAEAIVAVCGNETLNNILLNYYYWMAYNAFIGMYGSSFIDPNTPLSEQYITAEYTFSTYLALSAVDMWYTVAIYKQLAEAANYELEGELKEFMDGFDATLEGAAQTAGFDNVEDYLKSFYGDNSDYESYYDFYYNYCLATSYQTSIQQDYVAKYENETINTIDIRHILITPESESTEAWDAALEKAEEVYEDWKTVGTEEYFIELCAEHSADGNAQTGGIYENVVPGQMVVPFNDWCFDPVRQTGDTDIVATDYGYHIMYFVETNDEPYEDYPYYLADKDMTAFHEAQMLSFPIESHAENIAIFRDIA
ncbi:MAG: peptidylprolyl isomerase [Oscillospiraceae bacterium]|nr:peptidylprolyl isomerase [Oscillospiraceae bacterium]